MVRVLHRGISATLAAAVAGVGLIAVAPAAPPLAPPLRHVDVQLTYDAFDAVADNAQAAFDGIFGPSGAVADFFNFDLDGVLYGIHSGMVNLVLIPQNLLIGGLGALLGEVLAVNDFLHEPLHGLFFDPITDVSIFAQNALANMGNLVSDLFNLDLVGALQNAFSAFDLVVFEIPAALIAGTTEFFWSDLLGLP